MIARSTSKRRALVAMVLDWMAAQEPARIDDRWERHPLSRWYLAAWIGPLATSLAGTACRPWHLTLANFACALLGAMLICMSTTHGWLAALCVWMAWCCDRLDGAVARRQQSTSAFGAWLDANIDECIDLGLHAACAAAAAAALASPWPWFAWGLFVSGKYLVMHGLATSAARDDHAAASPLFAAERSPLPSARAMPVSAAPSVVSAPPAATVRWFRLDFVRWMYHLPGNADIRAHLAILALFAATFDPAWLWAELSFVAAYYQARWIARFALEWQRLAAADRLPPVAGKERG